MQNSFSVYTKLIYTFLFLPFLLLVAHNANGQNPTIISDSLVIMQRVHAKEKLVVDEQALFKQDIKVNGLARVMGDLRVDTDLRVDGTAKFNGNVKMENLAMASNLNNDSTHFLVRMPNGQLKALEKGAVINAIYAYPCGQVAVGLPDPVVTNPVWNNGINKIYASYCEDVKVGIGTNTPEYILDVRNMTFLSQLKTGSRDAIQTGMINGFDVTNSRDLIQLGVHNSSTGNISDVRFKVKNKGAIYAKNLSNQTSLELHNGTGRAIIVYANNGTKILQLEDDGLLRSRRVKVDLDSWADFVFKPGYKLMSLKQTEKYIDKNGHLPGVPSEEEIVENGLDLGDMQKIQMQKMEEMYLHMIEMSKEIEDLKKEVASLKK